MTLCLDGYGRGDLILALCVRKQFVASFALPVCLVSVLGAGRRFFRYSRQFVRVRDGRFILASGGKNRKANHNRRKRKNNCRFNFFHIFLLKTNYATVYFLPLLARKKYIRRLVSRYYASAVSAESLYSVILSIL